MAQRSKILKIISNDQETDQLTAISDFTSSCMSVFDTGMIEIVRNAITMASVQRSQGGVAGAFKNNALYDWLERKCPFQEKVSRYTVLIPSHVSCLLLFYQICFLYCLDKQIFDHSLLFVLDFGATVLSSYGEVCELVCRLLCSYICAGYRRPPQRQHYDH